MRPLPLVCLAAAALMGIAAIPAHADLNNAERSFIEQAASKGMAAVQTAQLAQQRSSSPQVKQFANRIVADHTQANVELLQIAQDQNMTLPEQPSARDESAYRRLSGLNGAAFDQAYAQAEVSDNQQNIALFRKEAQSGQDPALKSFAQKTLPLLVQHLQLAQSLNRNQ
jgi:putative membrane protein